MEKKTNPKYQKTSKSALVTSVLSLVLCFTMLIGTTLAWFTDSVTSAGNIIKSGTLDVTMEWKDATSNGAQQTYKDASEGAIFNNDLWEPGYVEAKNIKISNIGTLALKYNLNIAANGEVSDLADVIDVYFAEDECTLSSREMPELTCVGTLSDILDGMPANMSGDLEANTADTVTIALKMQEDAGNKYQGLAIGTDFKVVLMATQDNVEKDSFDENYDDIDVPDKDIKVIDGNTYYYYSNGVVALREVPYGNVGTTFTVPDGVTVIGIAKDKSDTDGPVFSKSSSVESITLPEGVTEINARAINMKTLTSINFPSTLTYIGEQAFRQTGMSELTIPANVKVIDEGAFRDMANLTTVTIEGDVAFDNYAFRSCPSLTSIYLLGDDVTFTGTGSQFATHSDNGDATGITIYVKNSTVAARVYAAQTSAYGYEVKVLGDAADGSDAAKVTPVENAKALQTALDSATDGDVIVLTDNISSDITATQKPGVNVEINGNGKTISAPIIVDGKSATYTDAGLTIKNVNFVADSISADACIRLGDGTNATRYTCNVTVDNCTFDVPGAVGVKSYTGGDKNLTITNCTATTNAHSLVQAKGIDGILVENCKVYSKNGLNFNNSDNVTVSGCTVDVKGYAVRFGESSGGVGAAETYLIENCTLKSACNDGDAVIILRGTADYATLTIENTTIVGTTEITNTATGATVVK